MRASLTDSGFLDGLPAATAWIACLLVDLEMVLKISTAVDPVDAGTVGFDSLSQGKPDGVQQPGGGEPEPQAADEHPGAGPGEVGESLLGRGLRTVHGEGAVDDQFLDRIVPRAATPEHDLAAVRRGAGRCP